MVAYICVQSFNNIASLFFQDRFNYSSIEAGYFVSITYGCGAIFCPIFGLLVDRTGKHVIYIFLSNCLFLTTHLIYLLIPDCDACLFPGLNLIILGMGYSIYASAMWGSIPYVVETKTIGTALGIATSMQNLGLSIGPLIVGALDDKTKSQYGYSWISFFFVIASGFGIATSLLLWIYEWRTKGNLIYPVRVFPETISATTVSNPST